MANVKLVDPDYDTKKHMKSVSTCGTSTVICKPQDKDEFFFFGNQNSWARPVRAGWLHDKSSSRYNPIFLFRIYILTYLRYKDLLTHITLLPGRSLVQQQKKRVFVLTFFFS